MTEIYTYSILSDFTNATQVYLTLLQKEITDDSNVSVAPHHINLEGSDEINIYFPSALNSAQKTALDDIIDAYVYFKPNITDFFEAIIDINGNGDYTSIAAAFVDGKTSLYVRNGIYFEASDIIIPDYGQINGESTGGVAIVLIGGSSIKCDGSDGVIESTGTISIIYNTKTVTGISTTFSNLSVNEFILIGTNFYKISSIESDISLTLDETYLGATISTSTYKASAMKSGIIMKNLIITGSSDYGIYLRSIRHCMFNAIVISKCTPNFYITNCADLSISNIISYLSIGDGLCISDSVSMSLNTVNLFNNSDDGMHLNNNVNSMCVSCASENNKNNGINIITGDNEKLVNCTSKYNYNKGIYSDTTSHAIVVNNCDISHINNNAVELNGTNNLVIGSTIAYNNGIAICIDNDSIVSCNQIINHVGNGIVIPINVINCSIINNHLDNITGIGIEVLSSESNICNNIIHSGVGDSIYINGVNLIVSNNISNNRNGSGIVLTASTSDCIITGNIVKGSSNDGLYIMSGATDNIVSNNMLKGNTGTNLNDLGTTTSISNNKY